MGDNVNLGFKVTNLNSIPGKIALLNWVLKEDTGNICALGHLQSVAKFGKTIDLAQAM